MEGDRERSACEPFECWGLVELMGRTRLAGKISEQTIGGCAFIRLDVPELEGVPGYTRLFTQSAIYGLTILTEPLAVQLAATLRAKPVQAYELPDPPAPRVVHGLAARALDGWNHDDDDDDDDAA